MTPGLPDLLSLLPGDPAVVHPLVALALAVAIHLVASAVARFASPRLRRRFRALGEALAGHLRPILRHAIAAAVMALAVALWPIGDFAHLILGAALALSLSLLAVHILRSLAIPRLAVLPIALLLFVMVLSGSSGGFAPVADMLDGVGLDLGKRRVTLLGLVSMAAICVALFALVRLANRIVGRSITRAHGLDATQKLLAQKLAAIVVVVAAFFIGVDLLGIDLTAFAVFSGALGLAVGFGLQKTFGNLIAGIILLMDRSIKPGDVIVVGDSFGWVNKIGVRAVSVITRDGKEHLIPNENLMTQEVENWSYSDRNVRVRIPVGIGYDSDLKLAQELMLRAAQESPRVLRNPKPNVWLTAFGENRVEHDILVWISDPESGVGNVKSDVLGRLWLLFREHGITIPYPQRVIHAARDAAPPLR
ncbi:small-conductance mechanosensitive channel [Sphingobium indicum IP26]|uniref:Mechanosensitive ion channel protein MscS n=1 Tax=Sphingobium indicum F2 TaxID=1450518 RepID=A0A8E1C445_9SPHN|nr:MULTISPECIES: mechanosensitive ion channel domain-containing protein [Sphingobium]EPR10726.1 small-conductance mechanosensitive channel [Sphingobium indicum IP26]EPR14235.1 small-conductance mechanosensitive channel [Sphingobium indicum IP26]EPR15778.1 small-conductance mechanosensitive channel [Sphingobium indicum IP26]EQB03718.1 small-conductance mechanosensitive channel [Sphingobium sp. HDIP04]KER37761.1 mechanosensitive ion channel protein MscS [Sphingobium indicum F2]